MRLILAVLALFVVTPALAQGVVSSADPRASEAGREMLRQGGSATDAAMAMMLALTVVEPQSSGIGGGGFLLHHNAETKLIETIDGREKAPASATPALFLDAQGQPLGFRQAFPGGKSVGVPGNIRLMALAHRRWGKLPWATLFAPAIRLAEDGFVVNAFLGRMLAGTPSYWGPFDGARSIYWANGAPKKQGDTVRNPALAKLLKRVAERGPDAFYTGDAAEEVVEAVKDAPVNKAVMTKADLAAYQAKPRPAVCAPYRVWKVCGMGPPSSGATTVLQILGMVERFDLKRHGKDSPKAWHLVAEAMQLAYADREKYLGDRDFVEVPVAGLIDRDYLAARSRPIAGSRALAAYDAGTPPGAARRTAGVSGEAGGTTHFVAVDAQGNVANMTSTIEGAFGSQLIANGFFLNNELTDFTFAPEKDGAPVANRVEPGKRPLSSMSPTIVYDRNGQVVLALGSAGGKRIIMHVAKTLIGVLDFGLPVADAIALPNVYFGDGAVLVEQGTPLAARVGEMTKLGQPVRAVDLGSKVNALERTPSGWRGAADPRSEGVALNE